jgi:hypothetical protein
MGVCFSSIYDVAVGDVSQDEAGSASPRLPPMADAKPAG